MKTKILLSALFASFLLVTNLSAQNPSFQWAKQMGSPDTDLGNSIAVDANGNVYVTGIFWGPTDFDPGAGTINLTSRGKSDIFIQKLDANGNLLWVKQMGGTGFDGANSITTDASGNIYTTGYFNSTVAVSYTHLDVYKRQPQLRKDLIIVITIRVDSFMPWGQFVVLRMIKYSWEFFIEFENNKIFNSY